VFARAVAGRSAHVGDELKVEYTCATVRSQSLPARVLALVAIGWVVIIANAPWGDNSALTHLETGRRILSGAIPRSDPYTFTAPGASWTVQSWLPSATMALFERVDAVAGVSVFRAVLVAVVASVGWMLCTGSDRVMTRAISIIPFLAIGQNVWSERPLMIGLACVGILLLAFDRRVPMWALIPAGWIWVNSHGSFALAPLLIATIVLGEVADARSWRVPSLRVGAWMAGGLVAGVLGPLGFATVRFPLVLSQRSASFRGVVEWQAPSFTSGTDRWFLVSIGLCIASVVVRPSWKTAGVVALTMVLALTSQRNIAIASLCTVWITTHSLGRLGSFLAPRPVGLERRLLGAGALASLIICSAWFAGRLGTGGYPVAALAHLEQSNAGRLAAPDFVGNFVTSASRGQRAVMFDDRVDVLPESVIDDELALLRGTPEWRDVLGKYDIATVLWSSQRPLSALLAQSTDWAIVWTDGEWIVAERVGS
jgi:hypothetical protein